MNQKEGESFDNYFTNIKTQALLSEERAEESMKQNLVQLLRKSVQNVIRLVTLEKCVEVQ